MSTFSNISNRCIFPHSIYIIVTIRRINCNSYTKLFLEFFFLSYMDYVRCEVEREILIVM